MTVCPCVHPSVLSVCLSVCLSISLSVCPARRCLLLSCLCWALSSPHRTFLMLVRMLLCDSLSYSRFLRFSIECLIHIQIRTRTYVFVFFSIYWQRHVDETAAEPHTFLFTLQKVLSASRRSNSLSRSLTPSLTPSPVCLSVARSQ